MLQDEELLSMFLEYDRAIQNYTRFDDWYLWVQMHKGTVSMPVFQSLEAFWPGLQSLLGNLDSAVRTFQNYYSVWRQFGGLPEFYSIPQGYTVEREGYPLRPGVTPQTQGRKTHTHDSGHNGAVLVLTLPLRHEVAALRR
ncbi:ER degradation-enhancing alpha-mannosidase-like protein 2 [Cottoperca gobio]|nr:ER degradation-enhancing alpha-mannosidase-like protein 2 [Cottoperca gobio]